MPDGAGDLLKDLRVLVVEDEPLVALLIEQYLTDFGCVIAASARRIPKAMEALDREVIQAAVLDMNIAGESVEPVAERLVSLGVPFLFASGYGAAGLSTRWQGYHVLQKPFSVEDFKSALVACLYS